MTRIDSICVRCKNLYAYTNGICINKNDKYLISQCKMYVGKNAGNRKTCKYFETAEESVIARRIECLKGE